MYLRQECVRNKFTIEMHILICWILTWRPPLTCQCSRGSWTLGVKITPILPTITGNAPATQCKQDAGVPGGNAAEIAWVAWYKEPCLRATSKQQVEGDVTTRICVSIRNII